MSGRLRGWILVAIQAVLLVLLVVGPSGAAWPVPGRIRLAGTLLRWGGGAAIVLGTLRLGRAASVHPAPTATATLRIDGPYRFVRHPIYTGVLLVAGGIAVSAATLRAVALLAALVVVLSVKARFEEALLAHRFDGYAAYASATPRFVPGLRRRNRQLRPSRPAGRDADDRPPTWSR